MIVKVCGMRDAENIRQVEELGGVSWIGHIFYPRSPRYVSDLPANQPRRCPRVGVFVNATIDDVVDCCNRYDLSYVQLHGGESPEYCKILKQQPDICKNDRGLIKALPISSATSVQAADEYQSVVDYMLFETPSAGFGGSGQRFDWSLLSDYHGPIPFILAGGIGPDDVLALRTLSAKLPLMAGIDLNSRFEIAPALKDISLINNFLSQLTAQ